MGEPSNAPPPVDVPTLAPTLVEAVPPVVEVNERVVEVGELSVVEVGELSAVVEVCEATIPASHARRTSDDPASHRARLARSDAVDAPLRAGPAAPAGIAAPQKGQVFSSRRT
jgi:hypothetical protein